MKDELTEVLEDNSFQDEAPEKVMEELHCLDLVTIEVYTPRTPPKKKTSHATKWWKKVTTKREKPLISPPIPNVPNHLSPWTFGEITLINSLLPYS